MEYAWNSFEHVFFAFKQVGTNAFNELSEDFVSDLDYKRLKSDGKGLKKNLMTTDHDPDSSSSNYSVARSKSLRQNMHLAGQKSTLVLFQCSSLKF